MVWSGSGEREWSAGSSVGVMERRRRQGNSGTGSSIARVGKLSELVDGVNGPLGCGDVLGGGGTTSRWPMISSNMVTSDWCTLEELVSKGRK